MQFSISTVALAFVATVAVVNAQDLKNIPPCAITCFAAAVPASGCSLSDTKCQCTTGRKAITDSIASCVPGKCSADEITKLVPAVAGLCESAGVTVSDLPTALPSGSASASASGSASRSGNASASMTPMATSSGGVPQQTTNAAVGNVVSFGAAALGLAAAIAL